MLVCIIFALLTASASLMPSHAPARAAQPVRCRASPCRASAEWNELINMAAALSDAGSLEADVLRVAATTSRGAASSSADATRMEDLISQLEASNQPDVSNGALDGSWLLAYAGCPAYRSSPFFWAFEALAGSAGNPLLAITDGLPFYRVGAARQIISNTAASAGTLVSAIEVSLYIFDALLPPQRSVMTSTARTATDPTDPQSLTLEMLTTEVKESNLPFSGSASFPTQRIFDAIKAGSSTVRLRTSYLSSTMRVTRAPDGAILVYLRE